MPCSISVLSYNVFMRPNPPFANDQAQRVRFLPGILRQYDVCVLQEIFDNPARRRLINWVKESFPHRTVVTGRATGEKGNGGVVIYSKCPIIRRSVKLFGDESEGADSQANKGIRYVCVRKGNRRIHLFGTHLQAGGDGNRPAIRMRQIQMLRDFIDSREIPATQPVLIAGDLNTRMKVGGQPTAPFKKMLEILDAKMPANRGTHSTTPGGRRLDYLLISNRHLQPSASSTQSRRFTYDDGKDLSDHFAVDGKLAFP